MLKDQNLIVTISGKNHQIFLFPTIIIEGINADTIKIDETKGCTQFCHGRLTQYNDKQNMSVLCVAIKKTIAIYEINAAMKPKYKRIREIELTMSAQSLQIIDDYLCVGLQSEFALYSLTHESTPVALVQEDRDKSLAFLNRNPTNALMAVRIDHDEYLLVFETLGLYVNVNGYKSRSEEIMWPSKPLHVTARGDYLLCYCDRGIDVFNSNTGEWLQIIQLAKTKPLDPTGLLSISHEISDSARLVYLKASDEGEYITVTSQTKNRSLVKSKYRKGSLSKSDENYLNKTSSPNNNGTLAGGSGSGSGSTGLNYSNSNVSSFMGFNSRKSLISNPINFQHLHHMGPSDGKSVIYSDLNTTPINNQRVGSNEYYSRKSMNTSQSSNGGGSGSIHIDKNDISGPTNFRHIQRGLVSVDDSTGVSGKNSGTVQIISSPSSLNKSLIIDNQSLVSNSMQDQQSNVEQTKSIQSLSSSSSTSSNIQHPHKSNHQHNNHHHPNHHSPSSTSNIYK